ncbi:diguanylate cyclase domain-containing protein [Vibrio sp. HN007]|uniref:sensor domain-containing diguanylate cyclase n=1 Tax=Vibrio iocasae TaxID=3098914 RepID=UPI0035D3DE64
MIKSTSVKYKRPEDLNEVVGQALGYPRDQILIQVFSGVLDLAIVNSLISEIKIKLPGVALLGTSTAGEIVNGESIEGEIIVTVTLFEHTKVASAITKQNDDLVESGTEIARSLKQDDIRVAIVFGCGLKDKKTIKGQALLTAIQSELPEVLIAGGQAGDNGHGESTFVFTEEGITESGVAAACLIGRQISASNAYNLSWVPIGKKLTITKVQGSRVYGIDNQTPYDIYCHYLGQEVADNLPLSAADFPFILEKDGIVMAVHATGVNDDGSFEYIHDFNVGEQLKFGFCHAGLLALGAKETYDQVTKHGPQAIFVYSCVSRKWILGADISVDLSSISGTAPSSGFFCYGEYFKHDNGKAYFFSQTMTVLSLTESTNEVDKEVAAEPETLVDEHSRQFRTMRVLHRLVDTSAREIESVNQQLASLARLDSLTGLSNRRRFDEKLQKACDRLGNSNAFLSILLLDVDYFKAYNDNYGHVAGDDCLRGIGEVLRNTITEDGYTAARYGGEEFACILPEATHESAMRIARNIQTEIELLGIEHKSSDVANHITMSIGVLTTRCSKKVEIEDLVSDCDKLLYEAKRKGRNLIVGKNAE